MRPTLLGVLPSEPGPTGSPGLGAGIGITAGEWSAEGAHRKCNQISSLNGYLDRLECLRGGEMVCGICSVAAGVRSLMQRHGGIGEPWSYLGIPGSISRAPAFAPAEVGGP